MTEITAGELAEIQWANSDAGKAAFKAAWGKLRSMGLTAHVDATQLGQIVYAAHLADDPGEPEAEPVPQAAAHVHDWLVLGTQSHIPFTPLGPPHTIALIRCRVCGEPDAVILVGEWSRDDLDWKDAP
jgi:hypothetical protein